MHLLCIHYVANGADINAVTTCCSSPRNCQCPCISGFSTFRRTCIVNLSDSQLLHPWTRRFRMSFDRCAESIAWPTTFRSTYGTDESFSHDTRSIEPLIHDIRHIHGRYRCYMYILFYSWLYILGTWLTYIALRIFIPLRSATFCLNSDVWFHASFNKWRDFSVFQKNSTFVYVVDNHSFRRLRKFVNYKTPINIQYRLYS